MKKVLEALIRPRTKSNPKPCQEVLAKFDRLLSELSPGVADWRAENFLAVTE